MFEAPQGWEDYYEKVISKCKAYIRSGYWEEIDIHSLRGWLGNFKTPADKYFSACMLDALVYRSRKMVDSSLKHISSSIIPNFFSSSGLQINEENLANWCLSLQTGKDVPFRFVAIEGVDNKPGKSGSIVARQIKESLDLAGHLTPLVENLHKVPDSVKAIVFIDDFSGTGEQFIDYYNNKVKLLLTKPIPILYAPLAAHEKAIANIEATLKNVSVRPSEVITEEDSFFFPIEATFRGDKLNSTASAEEHYLKICCENDFERDEYLFGKGNQALTFAFYFSTPNNNLKLLYNKKPDDTWKNLLNRNR